MPHGFTDALTILLREEGGFVNSPSDPGGMTNLGVTAATWAAYSGHPATEQVMRGLRPVDVAPLYRHDYWLKAGCDQMPPAVALCAFDWAVNSGPACAVERLQGIIGVVPDGAIGPKTLAALTAYIGRVGVPAAIHTYCNARHSYLRSLPTFPKFGKGWLARVERIEKEALSWL